MQILPSGQACGADIINLDVRHDLDDQTFKQVEDALHSHAVICMRDQHLSEAQQVAFTKRFGEAGANAFSSYGGHTAHPEILIVSNVEKDGKKIGNPNAGLFWHTDQSYAECPHRATLLYGLEIPTKDGEPLGDTLFANGAAAYDALPSIMKKRIEGLKAIHRMSARIRERAEARVNTESKSRFPDIAHPIARTHPYTKRKSLYVTVGECIGIEDMADDEALPLIEELFNHIIKPEFIYRHKWQVGDLLMWDNCTVQHQATKDYGPENHRLLYRTTVKGSIPF